MAAKDSNFALLRCLRLTALLLFLLPLAVRGEISFGLELDDIQGPDWQVSEISLTLLSATPEQAEVALRIGTLQLPDKQGEVRNLVLGCANVEHAADGWHCRTGSVQVESSPWQAQDSGWSGSWLADGGIRLELPSLAVAGGRVGLTLTSDGREWDATLTVHRLGVRQLAGMSGQAVPAGWKFGGRLSGSVVLNGLSDTPRSARADLVIDRLDYTSPDDTQIAQGVVVKLDGKARLVGGAWQFDSRFRWPQGEVYSEPLHIDANQSMLTINAAGRFSPHRNRLDFDSWSVSLHETLSVSGTGILDTARWTFNDLTIAAHSDSAGRVYQTLVQPFLIGTPGDDLQVDGRIGFVLHYDAQGVEQAGLQLYDLAVVDRLNRFAIQPSSGSVAWSRDGEPPISRLSTAGISIYTIASDPFDIRARVGGDRVDLLEPIVVPLLGGQASLESFALSGMQIAGSKPQWTANAALRDVSLARLTQALDWPPFTGSLSGSLRDMRYRDQLFEIGGGLEVRAFDGAIEVQDLQITNPLGRAPELRADARMRNLSLAAVTETFAFGRIEGRLDGDLDNLQLLGWQPAAFDLHLFTPDGDRSRHRISQRAVQNLTELGSGVPAGLSATFLGIFEEFSYDTIDVKVLLRGNVATLDGIARKDGGYYLVR
ncbi:MAG: hypothetical protein KDI82_15715, partial [Gammaproteobacteria bacterium]|nr:hypothetical protein [Gammaproteobacteria bacterium]